MDDRIEAKFLKIIRGDVQGWRAIAWRSLFNVLSKIYALIIGIRLFFFKERLLRQAHVGCTVISIGNLTVGGTGKTPIVEMLARELQRGSRKVAILSRGYKKKRQFWLAKLLKKKKYDTFTDVVSDGKNVFMNARDAGDEPYMLAKNLPGVVVLVDKSRVRAAYLAVQKFNIDTILLDDGYQYLRLGRRHDVVLVDCTNPFGYGHLLPRGLLRENIKNIKRADYIFLTKTEKVNDLEPLKKTIQGYHPSVHILECFHDPKYLIELLNGRKHSLDLIRGRDITVFSAIAHPEGFEDTLRRLGANIKTFHRYTDHHRFKVREIKDVILAAREHQSDFIVTTEKDAVRIPNIDWQSRSVLILRVEIRLVLGEREFSHFVSDLCYN